MTGHGTGILRFLGPHHAKGHNRCGVKLDKPTERRSSGTSVYRGVHLRAKDGKWVASMPAGSSIHIGSFVCESDAALAYDAECRKLGRYQSINTPNAEDCAIIDVCPNKSTQQQDDAPRGHVKRTPSAGLAGQQLAFDEKTKLWSTRIPFGTTQFFGDFVSEQKMALAYVAARRKFHTPQRGKACGPTRPPKDPVANLRPERQRKTLLPHSSVDVYGPHAQPCTLRTVRQRNTSVETWSCEEVEEWLTCIGITKEQLKILFPTGVALSLLDQLLHNAR